MSNLKSNSPNRFESLLIKIYDIYLNFFDPTALAMVYGGRLKFFRAEHSATAEGEN